MKFPKIDLKELDEIKEQNKKERLKFLDWYANYVKTHNFQTATPVKQAKQKPKHKIR